MMLISYFYDKHHNMYYIIKSIFAFVKKTFAISSLSINLFSTMELYQLLKMPLLIEHKTGDILIKVDLLNFIFNE
ncbi:MAG TPA: hypothetical protein VIJ75_13440 [Hanamia sp.]